MNSTLALRFDAPMQSWGIRSRGVVRDTTTEPTKSGVVGLLAAALGVEREDDAAVAGLAALRLGVRVDREGSVERDYHTAQNVPTTTGGGHRTVVSERYYLADALFLVVLEGPHDDLLRLAAAVADPRYPLFFGRKAFVPARPLLEPGAGPVPGTVETVLRGHPWLESASRALGRARRDGAQRLPLRTVVDCGFDEARAQTRNDHPVSFADGNRRHRTRAVLVGDTALTDDMIPTGADPCS